jgi:cyclin C
VQQFAAWLAESSVDIAAMVDATQEIVSFYECYEQYNDKLTREQINRFVKARGLDK